VLLTGQADIQDAVAAINDGQIFRYLTKPCRPADLEAALQQAVEQHQLRIAQRELLEETLTGSVRGLVELLALANPVAFGRATRARETVVALAGLIGFKDVWCIEMAAMLSQIGMLTLPPDLATRLTEGQRLSAAEEAAVARVPQEALRVLQGIPRLDEVRAILETLTLDFAGPPTQAPQGELIPLGARILRPILDLDRRISAGMSPVNAVQDLERHPRLYDPAVLTDLKVILGRTTPEEDFVELQLTDVQVGMTFVRDVRMPDGTLLIARRQPVTEALLDRIHGYWAHIESINPVRVAPAAG
jgi:response regulator RpfG family c-di-GMP phosphodiesterase